MPERRNEFGGVIALTTAGDYILQLRDDNPNIADPGKFSIFAGRLLLNETPEDGAAREFEEETTIRRSDLVYYRTFEKDPVRHGAAGTCHVYVANNVDLAQVHIQEGQGARVASFADLTPENTALISYDILKQFEADRSQVN